MNKRSTREIRDKAIELYKSGKSAFEVSEILGFNEATIRGWLKRNGVKIRDGGQYNKKYDDDILKEIKELYDKGFYATEIDKRLSLRRGASQYILNKSGYKMRHRGPKSLIKKEDFFDEIDNEIKAYFLGFIVADGNVSITNGQYSLKIHIAYKDKKIIDNFLKYIGSSNKTKKKVHNNSESYYVSLTSIHMCETLIRYGVIPQKTGKECIPSIIKDEYMNHFLRGFFDGDGITDISKGRSGFVGSANMIEDILRILNEDLTTFYSGKNKMVKYFLGGKKFSKKLYKYLYKDATIWLERKRNRLEEIIQN
ncbi:IS630 transposase-related protein, partial [Clostridium chrysemydis]|uniref:IS630 transposase-related protein n=1 Tax=Clostridium chrysemydis TaxID=2665504 RepID=UPI003F3CAB95